MSADPGGTGRALVLGTGGSLGYAWTLAALSTWQEATGRDAREMDAFVGTSAGSVIASALASGVSVAELLDHLLHPPPRTEPPRKRSSRNPLPPVPRPGPGSVRLLGRVLRHPRRYPPLALGAAMLPTGRGDLSGVMRAVGRFASETWPTEPAVRIVATDYDTGARVPFGRPGAPSASLAEAAAASSAVPGWFEPVRIGGRRYVDGGVCSSTSADLLLAGDLPPIAEALVLVPLARRGRVSFDDPATALDGMLRGLIGGRSAREIGRVRAAGVRVRAHAPGPEDRTVTGWNVMDSRRQAEVARTALRTTAAWWARSERDE